MKITTQIIIERLEILNNELGRPVTTRTHTIDGHVWNIGNYHMQQTLSGYNLHEVMTAEGGQCCLFYGSSKKEVFHIISGMIAGVRLAKEVAK